MAWVYGLRRWVSVAAAVSLAVTAAALAAALVAAADANAANHELSNRLVPAAAAERVLYAQYTAQQSVLRDYVTNGRPAGLAPYRQAGKPIPAQQAPLAALLHRYPHM